MTKARDLANASTALSAVDATELGYLDGVTSNIQTQFGNISGSKAQPSEPSSPTDGMIWVDTDGTAVGNQVIRWSKATANGTTTLSGNDDSSVPLSYVAGYEQVYQNGVLLARGGDYTATNGTSISLTNASVTGDIFEVFASLPVALVDTYTQTQANAAFINDSLLTTTGDTIYASAAGTPARRAIGTTGQVLTVSGGLPTWASPSAGKILQVVNGTYSTLFSTTSTSYVDSGPTLTITPTSATSTIYIIHNGNYTRTTSAGAVNIRIVRNGTAIKTYNAQFYATAAGFFRGSIAMTHMDSPATTSALTYKIQISNDQVETITAQYNNEQSIITAFEVAP
jgi:hypothetical protein